MLTTIQAAKIARDCIRQATGHNGPINPDSVLNTVGVADPVAREAVNDDIVTDQDIGVNHFEHELGPSDLTFTTESEFFELRDEIVEKAVPIEQDNNEEVMLTNSASTTKDKSKKKEKSKDSKAKSKKKNVVKSKSKEEKKNDKA